MKSLKAVWISFNKILNILVEQLMAHQSLALQFALSEKTFMLLFAW